MFSQSKQKAANCTENANLYSIWHFLQNFLQNLDETKFTYFGCTNFQLGRYWDSLFTRFTIHTHTLGFGIHSNSHSKKYCAYTYLMLGLKLWILTLREHKSYQFKLRWYGISTPNTILNEIREREEGIVNIKYGTWSVSYKNSAN